MYSGVIYMLNISRIFIATCKTYFNVRHGLIKHLY
jgi:hypothetical protein